jgi:PTS system galactitol-specific IIC component
MMLVLPGNRLLWGVDLATFPFFFAMMVPVFDGSVPKLFVTGVLLLVPVHYIATWLAPLVTAAGRSAGMGIGEGVVVTTGLSGSPANGVLLFGPPAGLLAGVAATLVVFVALRTWPTRMYVLAGASPEKAAEATERRHTGESPGLIPVRFGARPPSATDPEE